MDKVVLNVPKGIRYLSEWEGFSLPVTPSIINKQITGCGFTEWCIRNNDNIILCSPRVILLENKVEQHPGEVYYARNDLDESLDVDKDLTSEKPTKIREDRDFNAVGLEKIKESVQNFKNNIFYKLFQLLSGK